MPFKVTQRQTIVFIAGLAMGIAAAWAVFSRPSAAPGKAVQAQALPAAAKAAPVPPVTVAVDACAFTPVVATAAGDDGRVQVQDVSGRNAKDVDTWILDGKEAVAAGRQRDAEADFLMACRAAEKLDTGGVLPQAEAMYHLGRHYASLAGAAGDARSGELWRRAEGLFAASYQAFNARYGDSSDKTRFTAKGLAEAREHTGGAPVLAAAPAPAKAPEVKVAEAKVAKAVPAKVPPSPQVVQAAAPPAQPKAVPEPRPIAAKPIAPAAAPQPAVAAAAPPPPKAPEVRIAAAKPVPTKPRMDAAPAETATEATVVEPPARAVGSATGRVEEPADSAQ